MAKAATTYVKYSARDPEVLHSRYRLSPAEKLAAVCSLLFLLLLTPAAARLTCDTAHGYGNPPNGSDTCVLCPANSTLLDTGYCACVTSFAPTSAGSCSPAPNATSMAGRASDFFTLVLDGAKTPWVFGSSGMFTTPYPSPTPLAGVTIQSNGDLPVPATPHGATVVAISAGYRCGCLLFSDTTAGCFGDTDQYNGFSHFVSNGLVTDDTGIVLTNILQIAAAAGANNRGGLLLLRNSNGMKGVVTYLINGGLAGSAVDSKNNVIDPLNTTTPLQGAVLVANGGPQSCAVMSPQYSQPNAVVCFCIISGGFPLAFLGAKLTLDTNAYPFGPTLISVDAVTYISARSISVGAFHACATVGSLQVACWGFSAYGSLAGTPIGSINTVVTPAVQLSSNYQAAMTTFPSTDVLFIQSVSCGYAHTCVVLTDTANGAGVVRCWGQDGTTGGSSSATVYSLNQDVLYSDGSHQALVGVTSISAGFFATCVTLDSAEAVTCWGSDYVGTDIQYQLGDGGAAGESNTGPASGASAFSQLLPIALVASASATSSVTPTSSFSASLSATYSVSPSYTSSISVTDSISLSPTASISMSATPSLTPSSSVSNSRSVSRTSLPSSSRTPTVSATFSRTASTTYSPSLSTTSTPTPSAVSSVSSTVSPTWTSTASRSPTIGVSPTGTPSPSATPTRTPPASATSSLTSTPSTTPSPFPPPVLLSVALSDTSNATVFSFNMPINCAGAGIASSISSVTCSSTGLFPTDQLSSVWGVSSSCSCPAASTLVVTLGIDSNAPAGVLITVNGGILISAATGVQMLTVSSIAVGQRKLPPDIQSAQMSSSGDSISVQFDGPSSGWLGNNKGSSPCSSVFTNVNLGSGASCKWSTASVLLITMGTHAMLNPLSLSGSSGAVSCPPFPLPSSMLQLRPGIVTAVAGGYLSTPQQCVNVALPPNPVPLSVILQGPQTIGDCSDLHISAADTVDPSGRSPSFSWSLLPLNDFAAGSNVFATFSSPGYTFTEPALTVSSSDLVSGGLFEFFVTASNFLGASSTASINVTVVSASAPVVTIVGPTVLTTTPSSHVSITVNGSAPVCNSTSTDTPLSFAWSLLSSAPLPFLTTYSLGDILALPLIRSSNSLSAYVSRDPKTVILPYLQVGVQYVVQASVTDVSSGESSAATVSVSVQSGGVSAVIAGSNRQVGFGSTWTLDGSSSVDYDNIVSDAFVYDWSCLPMKNDLSVISDGTCVTTNGDSFEYEVTYGMLVSSGDGGIISMPAGIFEQGWYQFSLSVTKGTIGGLIPHHYRTAAATVVINVIGGAPPTILMNPIIPSAVVSPTDHVILSANVTGSGGAVTYEWSCAHLSSQQFSQILWTQNILSSQISLEPQLSSGYYTFQLTASANGASSTASITIRVNGVPRAGYVTASPASGVVAQTLFTFTAPGWLDINDNLPLSYNFAYTIAGDETTVLASPLLSSTASGIRLPQGDPSNGNIVYVVTYVTNVFGSVARCSTGVNGTGPVNVTSAPLPSAILVEFVLNESTPLLSNYQAQSDNSAALGSVIVFSSLLTSSSSSCYNIACNSSSVCSNGVCITSMQDPCSVSPAVCTAWVMRCPGSSQEYLDNPPLYTPTVECSGQGTCVRPVNATEGSGGTAVCVCSSGYGGNDCSQSATTLQSLQSARASLFNSSVSIWSETNPSSSAVSLQASALAAISNPPDQVDATTSSSMLTLCHELASSLSYSDTSTAAVLLATVAALNNQAAVDALRNEHSTRRRLGSASATDAAASLHQLDSIVVRLASSVLSSSISGENVTVLSSSYVSVTMGHLVASKVSSEFPGVDFTVGSLSHAVGAGADVNVLTKSWASNPYQWSPNGTTVANVVSVDVLSHSNGTVIPVDNAPSPILVSFTLLSDTDSYRCSYWNSSTGEWKSVGILLVDVTAGDNGSITVTCASSHLTDFTVAPPKFNVDFLHLSVPPLFSDIGSLESAFSSRSLVTTITTLVILAVGVLGVIVALAADVRSATRLNDLRAAHYLVYGRLVSGFGMDLLHRDAEARDRVALKKLQGHLKGLSKQGTMVMVVVFLLHRWWLRIREDHSWLSIIIPPLDRLLAFSRPQRVVTLCMSLLAAMMVSALFFFATPGGVYQVLITSILSTSAMLPFTQLLPLVFTSFNAYKSHTLQVRQMLERKHKRADVRLRQKLKEIEGDAFARSHTLVKRCCCGRARSAVTTDDWSPAHLPPPSPPAATPQPILITSVRAFVYTPEVEPVSDAKWSSNTTVNSYSVPVTGTLSLFTDSRTRATATAGPSSARSFPSSFLESVSGSSGESEEEKEEEEREEKVEYAALALPAKPDLLPHRVADRHDILPGARHVPLSPLAQQPHQARTRARKHVSRRNMHIHHPSPLTSNDDVTSVDVKEIAPVSAATPSLPCPSPPDSSVFHHSSPPGSKLGAKTVHFSPEVSVDIDDRRLIHRDIRHHALASLVVMSVMQAFIGLILCFLSVFLFVAVKETKLVSGCVLAAGGLLFLCGLISFRWILRPFLVVFLLLLPLGAEIAGAVLLLHSSQPHGPEVVGVVVIIHMVGVSIALLAYLWIRRHKAIAARRKEVDRVVIARINSLKFGSGRRDRLKAVAKHAHAARVITRAVIKHQVSVVRDRDVELHRWKSLYVPRSLALALVYLLCIAITALLAGMNIAYGIAFETSEERDWLISLGISIVSDFAFSQPLIILGKVLFSFTRSVHHRDVVDVVVGSLTLPSGVALARTAQVAAGDSESTKPVFVRA